jgi:hypothetical protein
MIMTLIEAIIAKLRQSPKASVEERGTLSKAGAEEINKLAPVARGAILKKRKQISDIDKMLEGSY